MTRQAGRSREQLATLKAALLTGSVLATFAGTYLLGRQEPVETASNAFTQASVTVIVPAEEAAALQLPPISRGMQIQLSPIPQVVRPSINPVARTRSSR